MYIVIASPKVPSTEYPASNTPFLASSHHRSKSCLLTPFCNMPKICERKIRKEKKIIRKEVHDQSHDTAMYLYSTSRKTYTQAHIWCITANQCTIIHSFLSSFIHNTTQYQCTPLISTLLRMKVLHLFTWRGYHHTWADNNRRRSDVTNLQVLDMFEVKRVSDIHQSSKNYTTNNIS